jgi:hypothetical protein
MLRFGDGSVGGRRRGQAAPAAVSLQPCQPTGESFRLWMISSMIP